ncbi:MAG: acetyltransferase [Planctomycetes bacterium]|nr:acetyltransferase [Planctomycetota bacterium]
MNDSIAHEPRQLLILGARSFAREVADLVSDVPQLQLAGFVENTDRKLCSEMIDGLPVHWVDDISEMAATHWCVCAFGSTKRIAFIRQAEAMGFRFASVIHPTARISRRSIIGDGSIISSGVQIATNTRIGRHALINRGALIGHDIVTGECISVGPGANIGGACRIQSGCYIGMGAIVIERLSIGEGSVVAAGAVVHRDVPAHVLVAGVPAVALKHGVDGL